MNKLKVGSIFNTYKNYYISLFE